MPTDTIKLWRIVQQINKFVSKPIYRFLSQKLVFIILLYSLIRF